MSVYLFGVIAAQGIAIIVSRKVDLFNMKQLAIIAVVMTVGLGGSIAFPSGIPVFGWSLPPIATGTFMGLLINFFFKE